MERTGDAVRAGRREWIGLAVIALPCLLYSMDLTVLYLAVPSLTAELEPSSAELLWITDIYGFFLAGFLITMGTLGDRIGRRRLLLIGAAAFGVALGARRVLDERRDADRVAGVARRGRRDVGAVDAVADPQHVPRLGTTDIRHRRLGDEFLGRRRPRAAAGRRASRVLLVGLCVPPRGPRDAVAARARPEAPAGVSRSRAGRLDLFSAGLSIVAVLAVVYGLKQIAENGVGAIAIVSMLVGLSVAALFVRRQQILADPLVDLRLFRSRTFSASLAANSLSIAIAFGIFLFIAQYLQLVLGYSPLEAGLWTVPSAGGFIAGSMLAPVLVRIVRPGYVVAGGLLVTGVGLALLAQSRHGLECGPGGCCLCRYRPRCRTSGHAGNRPRRQLRIAAARGCRIGDLRDRRRARRSARASRCSEASESRSTEARSQTRFRVASRPRQRRAQRTRSGGRLRLSKACPESSAEPLLEAARDALRRECKLRRWPARPSRSLPPSSPRSCCGAQAQVQEEPVQPVSEAAVETMSP